MMSKKHSKAAAPAANTQQPEEARNMQVQQAAAPEAAVNQQAPYVVGTETSVNMHQVGKNLDYLPMWIPIDRTVGFGEFEEWLKSNSPEVLLRDIDKYLEANQIEQTFDGFVFKEINHPKLDDLIAGQETHGDISFTALKDGSDKGDVIQFIIGARAKEDGSGWYESIVGWPEGAKLEIELESATPETPAKPAQDKIRMALFANNGNSRPAGMIRHLQAPQMPMGRHDFERWFNENVTYSYGLTDEFVDKILNCTAVTAANDDVRFFIHHALPAELAAAVTAGGDPSIAGYLDVVVVKQVDGHAGEFRQVGLFNFTTRAVTVPSVPQMVEAIDTFIHPDKRGATSVNFDADEVYTFQQFSDLFKAFDKDGAANLQQYQISVRNIIRRLYEKAAGSSLFLKAKRVAYPRLGVSNLIQAGKVSVDVYDTYTSIDAAKPLVTFDLFTGLSSDVFMNRNVELIQGVECPAADELKQRTEVAREQARLDTLATIGAIPGNASAGAVESVNPAVQAAKDRAVRNFGNGALTKFESTSYLFFMGTVQGILPLLNAKNSERLNTFLDYLGGAYGDTGESATFSFVFYDGQNLTIDIVEPTGNNQHFELKLAK
jgi:hypothetical protein